MHIRLSDPFSRCANKIVARSKRYMRFGKRYAHDEQGTTAVEFGIVGIPFLTILFAIIEVGFAYFNQEILENATANAARQLLTGQIQMSSANAADQKVALQNLICPTDSTKPRVLPGNFDCNKIIIDVRQATDFSGLDTSKALFDQTKSIDEIKANAQFAPGAAGKINVVRVMYPLPVFTPALPGFTAATTQRNQAGEYLYDGGWKRIIMGVAVFKVEPFS
jgi:Flp pilus assembly protein TadG